MLFDFPPTSTVVVSAALAVGLLFTAITLDAIATPGGDTALTVPSAVQAAELPLAADASSLPLRDPLVAVLGKGSPATTCPWYDRGVFTDGAPVRERRREGSIEISADPGRHFAGWSIHFDTPLDWSTHREASLALRIRNGRQAHRRFGVELKRSRLPDDRIASWQVDLKEADLARLQQRGFADVVLPLGQANAEDLKHIREVTLVFSGASAAVPGGGTAGTVDLHSLRLVLPAASPSDPRRCLDDLARRAFDWFERYRDPASGLVPDRAPNRLFAGPMAKPQLICSVASVGYYLSMLPDAVEAGYIGRTEAAQRALQALNAMETLAETRGGLYYHFIDIGTGRTLPNTEISALDTAIFFNGCMVASMGFGGEVAVVADRLVERADWRTLSLSGNLLRRPALSMGWKEREGLLWPMDVRSSEFAMPYFLAAGASAEKAIDPGLWRSTRVARGKVEGRSVMNPGHGLFTAYYGLGWFPLEGVKEHDGEDLWQNAVDATLANREFCRSDRDPTYAPEWGGWWGISAGDSPAGYIAPGPVRGEARGTAWPTTALAALPWAEAEIEADLASWQQSPVWPYVDGPFGLAPFSLSQRWVGQDLIGIDLGSFYLAVANQRRQTVWNLWRQHPVARQAMARLYGQS